MSHSSTGSDDDDGDYGFTMPLHGDRRYPLHDCCEFEDAAALRKLIYVPQEQEDTDDDDDDDEEEDNHDDEDDNDDDNEDDDIDENSKAATGDDNSSSSDDNDSAAAAHAAAIGHSPQPLALKRLGKSLTPGDTIASEGVASQLSAVIQGSKDDASAPTDMIVTGEGNAASPVKDGPGTATAAATTTAKDNCVGNATAKSDGKDAPRTPTPASQTASATPTANETATTTSQDKSVENGKSTASDRATAEDGEVNMDTNHNADTSPPTSPDGDRESASVLAGAKTKGSKSTKLKKVKYHCPHNLNERDGDENTPLHVAIHARKLEHVKILLEAGANVFRKCDGSAPMHTAISMGAVSKHAQFAYQCVELLHDHDADLCAKDDAVHTPLYLACFYNLPQIVQFLLSKDDGLSTLNVRSDRSGGRALHAAAKFDTLANGKLGRGAAAAVASGVPKFHHHHPDGTIPNSMHHIPGYHSGKIGGTSSSPSSVPPPSGSIATTARALVTEILLEANGIEVDAPDSVGQSALHVACGRGNWTVARLLLQAGASPGAVDKRGYTPGQLAYKRGMPVPNDLLETLGAPPETGTIPPPRDLVVDPHSSTLILSHELCTQHRSCPPMIRDATSEPPPENVRRLTVLVDEETGILKTGEFGACNWDGASKRAAMVDVLKCHEFNYVERISHLCSSIPDHPNAIGHLDADTAISRWSFEAALRAAGSVCQAVDRVVAGDHRNAFCAVRPPGHHAGPRGIVRCENDADGGSHGFCLLNNVAIGAAYARSMYRNEGIRKIAIVDFDVHHGNGTEEIIRQLAPTVEKAAIRLPFAVGEFAVPKYRPWLDETDINDVFFASTHGYGPRGLEYVDTPAAGWFYPASGKAHVSDAIGNPSMVDSPNVADFILSQTWTRIGEEARTNCCKIMNCALGLPRPDAVAGMQRLELRDTYRQKILPKLREFDPDIIFISAGFDAHKKDTMNFGYVGMVEDDYEWVTEQLVKIANTCCNGRIVSVLEGGYKIHGGIVSPFARSVASHVRALADGGKSRELYDSEAGKWESQFERHIVEERERKRQQKVERLKQIAEQQRQALFGPNSEGDGGGADGEDGGASTRKRKRNVVDYRELYEQMKREGFAG